MAILDIDYHHGNGQQDIFYDRDDVLTVSIHGHPHFAYPYFSGFEDETGSGRGVGFNVNLPQPEKLDGKAYRAVLAPRPRPHRTLRADLSGGGARAGPGRRATRPGAGSSVPATSRRTVG